MKLGEIHAISMAWLKHFIGSRRVNAVDRAAATTFKWASESQSTRFNGNILLQMDDRTKHRTISSNYSTRDHKVLHFLFSVLSEFLHINIRDQKQVHKMLETRANLKTCLSRFSDDSTVAPMASRNSCFRTVIQLQLVKDFYYKSHQTGEGY